MEFCHYWGSLAKELVDKEFCFDILVEDMKKPVVDTPYKGSWADEEFKRTHRPITQFNPFTGKHEIIGYEKIHLPLPNWWGKPSILIPGIENATRLGSIA